MSGTTEQSLESGPQLESEEGGLDWALVVFQVENRLFQSFRHVFASASDVFQDMFLLPPGQAVEGSSNERPIVLHGCDESGFASLMKVLHPTRSDVFDAEFDLSQEEWLGVLRLSTMWEMQEIRQLCIENLFQDEADISPVDLVLHARKFRIRSWFLRAVRDILTGMRRPPLETLISSLGLSTVCKVMDMETGASLTGIFRLHVDSQGIALVQLDRLCCGHCNESLFTDTLRCPNTQCREVHELHAEHSTTYVTASSVLMSSSMGRLGFVFPPTAIHCSLCGEQLCGPVMCSSCLTVVHSAGDVFIGYNYTAVEKSVAEVFAEEIKGYDL